VLGLTRGPSFTNTRRFYEEAPFQLPVEGHSNREKRFRAIGYTDKGRSVFMVFTLRKKEDDVLIRPISARSMYKKEVDAYEKENPNL
jgi:uncharacterized DUF497 family protein